MRSCMPPKVAVCRPSCKIGATDLDDVSARRTHKEGPQHNGYDPDYLTFPATRRGRPDPGIHPLLISVQTLGVDLEQDIHRVTGALGHFGGRNPGVEPQGHSRMPQFVWPPSERGRHPVRGQGEDPRLRPDPRVCRRGDHLPIRAAEQPALLIGTEPLDMLTQQYNQLRRNRHIPRLTLSAVFEPPVVVNLPAVGVPPTRGRS